MQTCNSRCPGGHSAGLDIGRAARVQVYPDLTLCDWGVSHMVLPCSQGRDGACHPSPSSPARRGVGSLVSCQALLTTCWALFPSIIKGGCQTNCTSGSGELGQPVMTYSVRNDLDSFHLVSFAFSLWVSFTSFQSFFFSSVHLNILRKPVYAEH